MGLEGDPLTEAEAEALAQVVMSQGFSAAPEPTAVSAQAVSSLAFDPIPVNEEVSVSNLPCPLGGTYGVSGSISGTVDPEAETLDVTYTFEHTHSNCGVSPEQTDVDFTLNGSPSITHAYDLVADGTGSLDFTGTIEGAVDWSTDDGRSGTCPIDVALDVSGFALDTETGSVDVNVSGVVCGVEFSRSLSVNSAT